jgi:hypothetical protein
VYCSFTRLGAGRSPLEARRKVRWSYTEHHRQYLGPFVHKHCLSWDVLPVTQGSPCVSPLGCRASAALNVMHTGIDTKHWQASALPVEGCARSCQDPQNDIVTLGTCSAGVQQAPDDGHSAPSSWPAGRQLPHWLQQCRPPVSIRISLVPAKHTLGLLISIISLHSYLKMSTRRRAIGKTAASCVPQLRILHLL